MRETLYNMLSQRQKDILVGTILGDGHLEQNGRGVRLRVDHSMAQSEYISWKYREFENIATNKPRLIKSFHKKENKFYERMHFSTYSNGLLVDWRNMFYKDKIKFVPKDIATILTSPLSLAVWFMDDGYKRNDCNALRISTDLFFLKEQKILVGCLKTNFGVNSTIHKKGKTYNIYIPEKASKKFCEIVKPYFINSLLYKVSLTP